MTSKQFPLPDGFVMPKRFTKSHKLLEWFYEGAWEALQGVTTNEDDLLRHQGLGALEAYKLGYEAGLMTKAKQEIEAK